LNCPDDHPLAFRHRQHARTPRNQSGSHMASTQSRLPKPPEDVLGRHQSKSLAEGVVKAVLRPGRRLTEELLDLREHLLDRVEVTGCAAATAARSRTPAR